jgi:hypothetical protein
MMNMMSNVVNIVGNTVINVETLSDKVGFTWETE